MALLLGNQATPVDDTTMVIYRGSRKPIHPERKRDLARRCGINFIRLLYKHSLSTTIGVSGFQHVKLRTQPRKGGGIEPVAQWHQNAFTLEPMAEGAMDFVPDEMGTGCAYLPDSPFNRVRLAYAEIAKNALWTIDDKEVYLQICDLANEIRESIKFRNEMEEAKQKRIEVEMRVKEQNVAIGIEHKDRLEIEVGVLKDTVKKLELAKMRESLKKRIVELQGENPEYSNPVEPELIPEPVKASFDDDAKPDIQENREDNFEDLETNTEEQVPDSEEEMSADQIKSGMIKRQAKVEVHMANQELIESIKSKYFKRTGKRRGWAFSPEYRDKIGPMIKTRIQELMNEHATAGVAD